MGDGSLRMTRPCAKLQAWRTSADFRCCLALCMSLVNAAAIAWYDLRRRLASGTALAGSTTVCRASATVLAFGVGGVINLGSLAGGMGSPVFGTRPHAAGALSRLAAE